MHLMYVHIPLCVNPPMSDTAKPLDPRTRLLLEGPIARTLLKLAAPNVLVMFVQASVGLIETYFVGKLGTDALAGVSLVFPVLMLMQMMSAGAMGGGIAAAIARALGGGRRADADALVLHALVIAVLFGLAFMLAVLGGGRWIYPVGTAILLGFIVFMAHRLTEQWSDWLLGFALFDAMTLALVLNEWRKPAR